MNVYEIAFITTSEDKAVLKGVEAVSYTHLDVYKRQIHSSLELVDVRSRWRSTCPIPTTSVRNNSEIWMRNPLKLSIAATDIAVGAVMPWR